MQAYKIEEVAFNFLRSFSGLLEILDVSIVK